MIWVFCDTTDLPALWAAGRLRARGLAVEIATAPVLEAALSWRHPLSADGEAAISITLADGRRIDSRTPVPVLNRLTHVPRLRVDAVGGADRDYAAQEMGAFFLSWLEALPGPVVNRASPQGLGGRWRRRSAWLLAAAQAGLPAAPYRQSHASDPDASWMIAPQPGTVTVFAVGEVAVGPPGLPATILDGCVRLAKASAETLLGVDLAPGPDGRLAVIGASPNPDLRLGGEPLIDALVTVLDVETERREAMAS
jgi:hypothetical protein